MKAQSADREDSPGLEGKGRQENTTRQKKHNKARSFNGKTK